MATAARRWGIYLAILLLHTNLAELYLLPQHSPPSVRGGRISRYHQLQFSAVTRNDESSDTIRGGSIPMSMLSETEQFTRFKQQIHTTNRTEYENLIPIMVSILREQYGRRSSWLGDLSASETRQLYQRLLPRVKFIEREFQELPLKDRAYIASTVRVAAKLYARERCFVTGRVATGLYDGMRGLVLLGRWSWTGMTIDEIWLKYEDEVKSEAGVDSLCVNEDLQIELYERILERSFKTNSFIDCIVGVDPSGNTC